MCLTFSEVREAFSFSCGPCGEVIAEVSEINFGAAICVRLYSPVLVLSLNTSIGLPLSSHVY